MATFRRPIAEFLLAALAMALCAQAAAQVAYKCKNAAGKITYAGQECDKLGLTNAGEVKDRTSVAPAYKAPESSAGAVRRTPVDPKSPEGRNPAGFPESAKKPERRCFVVKTAKGTATRCNDVTGKAE